MEGIRQLRKAHEIAGRRRTGQGRHAQTLTTGQVTAQWHTSEILTLPADISSKPMVQVMDVASGDFAKFYLNPLIDPPGSGNLLG